MVKSRIPWSTSTGEQFTFEYEITRNRSASSVKNVRGTIYHLTSSSSSSSSSGNAASEDNAARPRDGAATAANSTEETPTTATATRSPTKKLKREQEVGYFTGYELRRGANGNKNFHNHADAASSELQDFACSLFDHRGELSRAPRSCGIRSILHMDGSMFLIEMMEIKPQFRGRDLGIRLLHQYLSQPDVARRVGLVVMFPWALALSFLEYAESKEYLRREREGKNENQEVDLARNNTLKLRRQYSRMGFQAVDNTPDWVDKWWMSMKKYKTMKPDDIEREWLSKEEALGLDIPMPARKHVCSTHDTALKELFQSLKPDPYADQIADRVDGLRREMEGLRDMVQNLTRTMVAEYTGTQLSNNEVASVSAPIDELISMTGGVASSRGSKLTGEKKAEIQQLVDQGADLRGINALHLAASMYKTNDLFDLLIDTHEMNMEQFDDIGRRPLHVAACCSNIDAVRILLAKGAEKNGKNAEGQTALEEMNGSQGRMDDFTRAMLGGAMGGGEAFYKIRALLLG